MMEDFGDEKVDKRKSTLSLAEQALNRKEYQREYQKKNALKLRLYMRERYRAQARLKKEFNQQKEKSPPLLVIVD